MGFTGYKFTDRQVKSWARHYTSRRTTLEDMENQLDVSHSTIWWCFQHRLYNIDVNLYDRVLERLDYNKRNHRGGRRNG